MFLYFHKVFKNLKFVVFHMLRKGMRLILNEHSILILRKYHVNENLVNSNEHGFVTVQSVISANVCVTVKVQNR